MHDASAPAPRLPPPSKKAKRAARARQKRKLGATRAKVPGSALDVAVAVAAHGIDASQDHATAGTSACRDEKAQQISNREQRRKIMLVKAKRSSMSSRNIQNPLIKRQRERDEQRQRNIELVEMQTDKNLFVGVETTHSEVLKRPPTHHACCSRAKFALANVLVFWLATAIVLLVYFGALQQAWWTFQTHSHQ